VRELRVISLIYISSWAGNIFTIERSKVGSLHSTQEV
jgi:hypothetical protein